MSMKSPSGSSTRSRRKAMRGAGRNRFGRIVCRWGLRHHQAGWKASVMPSAVRPARARAAEGSGRRPSWALLFHTRAAATKPVQRIPETERELALGELQQRPQAREQLGKVGTQPRRVAAGGPARGRLEIGGFLAGARVGARFLRGRGRVLVADAELIAAGGLGLRQALL